MISLKLYHKFKKLSIYLSNKIKVHNITVVDLDGGEGELYELKRALKCYANSSTMYMRTLRHNRLAAICGALHHILFLAKKDRHYLTVMPIFFGGEGEI